MPKRKTVAAVGECYHIYNRGALRMLLFFSPTMYYLFLTLMQVYAEKCNVVIIAVCLMPNHFHLLVRVEAEGRVDLFMHMLCGEYSRRVNAQLKRTGTIYEGRYQMKHVTTDSYFKCLCRYIHNNPIKGTLVRHPAEWVYSNLRETLGLRSLIQAAHSFIIEVFGSAEKYESYLLENIHSTKIDDLELAKDLADMRLV
ncbi:MAG: transposase [Ignavibacteria bacterium]|nr:transposase [Ignavibacteria bacterium]